MVDQSSSVLVNLQGIRTVIQQIRAATYRRELEVIDEGRNHASDVQTTDEIDFTNNV